MRRHMVMTCARCGKVRDLRPYDITKTRSHGALCQPCASALHGKKRAYRKAPQRGMTIEGMTVDDRLAEIVPGKED